MHRIQQLLCPSQEDTMTERRHDAQDRLVAWKSQHDDHFIFYRVTAFREVERDDGAKFDTPEAIECRFSWTDMDLDDAFNDIGDDTETFTWPGRETDTEVELQQNVASFCDPRTGPTPDPKNLDLQYNRARCFDPSIGRWISDSPLGYEVPSDNLYPPEAPSEAPETRGFTENPTMPGDGSANP